MFYTFPTAREINPTVSSILDRYGEWPESSVSVSSIPANSTMRCWLANGSPLSFSHNKYDDDIWKYAGYVSGLIMTLS
jgi:hypothetical protein